MIERHEFPNSPYVVAEARRFVTEQLRDVSTELTRVIGLMVSELATNCVRHTTSAFTIEVEQSTREVSIRVTDQGAGEPIMRLPDATEPSGRGLRLVEKLADSFGVAYDSDRSAGDKSGNKTVWFVVQLKGPTMVGTPDERSLTTRLSRRPAGGERSQGGQGGRASERR